MILEGESGIGKSMFLRYLVKSYGNLIVFLIATDCRFGVLEAVQAKLEGHARDRDYLNKLIYTGALDIVIDGLNEASYDTRAAIIEFAKRFSRGNLLLVTQPMVWKPPPLSKVYVMQLLTDSQIEDFLISRFDVLTTSTGKTKISFEECCRKYIRSALSNSHSKNKLDATRRVLSNPMDLTVVARMLVNGQSPDLFELQQQHFLIMEKDYRSLRTGNLSFPMKEFAEHVYKMRIQDQLAFEENEFVKYKEPLNNTSETPFSG